MRRSILGQVGFYALIAFIIFYAVFPFYWAVASSLKGGNAIFDVDLFPANPSLANYTSLFAEQPFALNILNSLIVATVATAVSLGASDVAAVRYLLAEATLHKAQPLPVDIGALARYDRPMPSVADYDTLLPCSPCVGTA